MHIRKGGVTRTVQRAWIRTGGVTKQFFADLGASGITVDHSSVAGAISSSSAVTVTSKVATVSVDGGVAPFSYAWTQLSGPTMTATNPTGNASAFQASVSPSTTIIGSWQCEVTDAAGTTGTVDVNVTLRNIGGTL